MSWNGKAEYRLQALAAVCAHTHSLTLAKTFKKLHYWYND